MKHKQSVISRSLLVDDKSGGKPERVEGSRLS